MIPRWLQESAEAPAAASSAGKRDFIEKTVLGVVSVFKQAVFSEVYQKKPGLMQKIDPRVKLATVVVFIVSLSTVRRIELVIAAYVLTILIAHCSQIGILFFVKRVWLFVPLFTGLVAIPAILNLVTPGEPLLVLLKLPTSYQFGPWTIPQVITVTEPGLKGALLFTTRVAAMVSAAVLLTLTTKWNDLLRSLRVFRVPTVFVTVLGMTYRYIFLFLRTLEQVHLARKSRTIVRLKGRENRFWVASQVAATFNKSLKLSEDVHSAMVARGFGGEPRVLDRYALKSSDFVWLAGAAAACVLFLYGGSVGL